jgi:hypothetical protein
MMYRSLIYVLNPKGRGNKDRCALSTARSPRLNLGLRRYTLCQGVFIFLALYVTIHMGIVVKNLVKSKKLASAKT